MAGSPCNTTAKNDFGKRLIPHVIDQIALEEPERECLSVPRSSDPKDGWKPLTFKALANAVNRCCHKIIEHCGKAPEKAFPTITYIGPNDARYHVLMIAAVKVGYKVLFISTRNSQEAQMNLFDKTDCHVLAFPKSHRAMVQPWLQERDMKAIEVASLEAWFPEEEVPHFPYEKTFEEAEWDPLCVLHTSGSTGLPKPIIVRQGLLACGDGMHNLPDLQGNPFFFRTWTQSKKHFLPMPLFHAAGLYLSTILAIYWGSPVALGIADRPLSSDLVQECLKHCDAESTVLPPAILEDMSHSQDFVESLARLKHVAFGGGNLTREAGNRLVADGVSLQNMIAATECCPFPIYTQPNPKLWQYFIFNSDVFGCDWRRTAGEEDVYEQVIVRKGKHPGLQGYFYTFPELNEVSTKDLYKPHPTEPNNWIYYGRADNIIVFSNGEKLNPITIEEIVGDHPQLIGALVVGTNRFQPGLIIEPAVHPTTKEAEKELIDSVWQLVVQANKETVAHGQIGRDFVRISNPQKPFLRAGKGTVQRAGTVKLYQEEIDQLYEEAGQTTAGETPKLDVSSEEALAESIKDLFHTHLGASGLEADADFFSSGIDSMQVIGASRLLRAALEAAGHQADATALATRVVYSNPTPRRLASYIMERIIKGANNGGADSETVEQQKAMSILYSKYTENLPVAPPGRPEARASNQTVLLTGSTGMLGSYMLHFLVQNPNVQKVVCLNRAEDGGAKQQAKAMAERGLDATYGGGKAEFQRMDVARSDLGLSRDVYTRLLKEADRIIINAWPVNFNIPVESFDPHLRGVRNMGDLAAKAERRVAVVFISSIGTIQNWDTNKGLVPEEKLTDLSIPSGGYGRSKLIGGLILEDVARSADFPAAVIRVGQIAGPEADAGVWNRHEWLPSIVASSLYLKALPNDLGSMDRVDWTPVESIAKMVLEIIGATQPVDPRTISGYYHGVNPVATSWSQIAPAVREYYGQDRLAETVSFKEWVDRLQASQTDDTKAVDQNPGIKLLDSYRAMADAVEAGHKPVALETKRTQAQSPTMNQCQAITQDLMKQWCKHWGF